VHGVLTDREPGGDPAVSQIVRPKVGRQLRRTRRVTERGSQIRIRSPAFETDRLAMLRQRAADAALIAMPLSAAAGRRLEAVVASAKANRCGPLRDVRADFDRSRM
jgi:hypothetical protein